MMYMHTHVHHATCSPWINVVWQLLVVALTSISVAQSLMSIPPIPTSTVLVALLLIAIMFIAFTLITFTFVAFTLITIMFVAFTLVTVMVL